jgi:hypothetical protein
MCTEFQSVDKITHLSTTYSPKKACHCGGCSSYKLRIESMLLKEEFAANMGYLEPSINSMIVAGEGGCQQLAHINLSLLTDNRANNNNNNNE